MVQEILFMTIVNRYLQIHRYFRIQLRPEMNILYVMQIEIVSYSNLSTL